MKRTLLLLITIFIMIAPAFAEMVSASSRIEIGTMLYNQDGSEFGKVLNIDDNHIFPNGKKDRGVLVSFGSDATPQWVVREFIINSKFVKTTDPAQQSNAGSGGSARVPDNSSSSGSGGCCCGCFPAFLGLFAGTGTLIKFLCFK